MQKFWVVILTLMGAGLRVYQLTERSLWTDESITLIRIQHSWGDILRNHVYLLDLQTIDTNPFAYFIGLKLWALGAGSSEFALKLFSAWLGVLMIPLTYALGRRLLGHQAALLAALFVLLSPGIEWYSHELRMYTLVGCMSALNGILVFNAIAAPPLSPPPIGGGRGGAAYILAFVSTLLSIATHYTFIGQAAAFWGLMGVALWQRRRRSATPAQELTPKQRRLGLAIGLILGLTALTLSTSSTFGNLVQRLVTGQENDYFFVPLHLMWNSVINGFVFGLNAGDPSGGVFAWLLCGVAALAFALPLNPPLAPPQPPPYRGGGKGGGWGGLIAGGLMPLLAWFGISFIKSNFQGLRHMFLLLPYVAVALAGVLSHYSTSWPISHSSRSRSTSTKIQNLKSKIQNTLILLTLIAQSYGLVGMFTPSEHWYDDWRGVAYYVRDHWLAGDVLVLNSQTVHGAIDLYAHGLTWEITPPVQNNTRDTVDEAKLRELSQRYTRLWFVHEKPNNQISAWLAQNTFFRQRTGFAARNTILQAELYDAKSPILPPTSSAWNRRNIAPQPNLPLQWMGDSISPNLNSPSPQPNVHVRLYLQRNSDPLPPDYAITYRLIGEDGSAWLNWDQPIDLSLAPATWQGDNLYWVDMVLPLPVGLPILPYRLQVQARAGGQTLQTHEERLSLAAITNVFRVAPPPYRGGDKGGGTEYPRHLKPGDYLPLALTWQLDAANKAGWTTTLHLSALLPPIVGGNSGEISVTKPLAAMGPFAADSPIQPDLPAQVGQAVRDLISLQVPPSAKAGWYGLWLTRQRDGQRIDWQWLGSVQVQDYAAAPLPPPSHVPINAKVGELTVLGYDVDRALAGLRGGDTLHFNTQWRVEGSPSRDGVLFLHILGPDGKLAAQHDSPPITAAGLRPTQTYRAGEGINQTHHLTLKPDAAPGEYRILLGVYDRSDEQRWPAQLNGAAAQDDLVELGRFVLK